MNVLILTPDRVGSTLLQRLMTVYAIINSPGSEITVNLHELTNGLVLYENQHFGCSMLGKKSDGWGYHQSLRTITEMLSSTNHGVISRLAHYHIKNRHDPLPDQLDFYRYLNDNFYIIAARRQNLFEHALSWAIAVESKKLNVYSHQEKYDIYQDIQEHGIDVQQEVLVKYLNDYLEYQAWVDRHFRVNAYFEYERDLPDIENFVLKSRPFQRVQKPLTWHDRFGITWHDWNRMHYLLSLVPFNQKFDDDDREFMSINIDLYTQARIQIQDWQDQGLLVSGIPIKLHTLKQKSQLITNAPQCLTYYNQWASLQDPGHALTYTVPDLQDRALLEQSQWHRDTGNLVSYQNPKLLSADLKSV